MEEGNTATRDTVGSRTWIVMAVLAITGQIAWAVENSWFNAFVYDTITPDPRPVAWMVAASAVVATLTTILMGTLSDRTRSRWGRRKPFILVGYVLWGLMTVLFPMSAFVKQANIAVLMVILFDCLMTFFGSTANDAAFNAWTADVTPNDKRGRVEGLLSLCLFIAQLISIVAAGVLIEQVGYFVFFYALGGLVMLAGFLAGSQLREPAAPADEVDRKPYWSEIRSLFSWSTVRGNPTLFILLLVSMLMGIGFQVAFPYMIVYINHYIGVSKSEYSLIGGAVIIGSALLSLPIGALADRWSRRALLALSIVLSCLGCFTFSLVRTVPLLALCGLVWQAFNMAGGIALTAWLKDLLPAESRGRFLGIRMIFWVALPMLIGPAIGSALIQRYGVPAVLEGVSGFVPVPIIFQVGAALGLLAIVPVLFFRSRSRLGCFQATEAA